MHADYNIEVAYLILSVAKFLGLSNCPCCLWTIRQKAYQSIGLTIVEQVRMDKLWLWAHFVVVQSRMLAAAWSETVC